MSSLRNLDTGEVYNDIDSIYEFIISYNVENMSKMEVLEEIKEIQQIKDAIVDLLRFSGEFPQTIPWEVYMDVVRKVMVKHKGVYCDFVKFGPKWKVAIYCLVNKIYIEEVIPDSMKTTKLTKLYKRKGALESTTLKRSWSSRLSETIIMLRYGLNASPAVLFSQDHTTGFLTSLTSNGTRCSPRPSWHGELVA